MIVKARATRRSLLAAALLAGLAGAALTQPALAQDAVPQTPEPGTFKLGVEPWLGYGQWHVASSLGTFKANGLEGVDLVNFTEDKDINAALASGQLDGASIATHTAMAMKAAGLPVKIVALLDVSMSADAILAGGDVTSVAQLKGKPVAFEQGTTSDILLNYALRSAGLTIADVQPVPMPAADAGSALIAGRVPVAVTYEPYLTTALHQDTSLHLLFTAGRDPGLVSDVLVVREDVAAARPGQVRALVRSWDQALQHYRAHTKDDRGIIATAVGSSEADLDTAFEGVRYTSLAENKAALDGDFTAKTFADVAAAATKAGILTAPVEASSLVDARFVRAAQ